MNTKQIKKLLLAVLKALRESVCWEKAYRTKNEHQANKKTFACSSKSS